MKVTNKKSSLFHALKASIAEERGSGSEAVQQVSLGNEVALRVRDEFESSIVGYVPGSQHQQNLVTVHPHSIVDNRPETMDTVYFSYADESFRVREERDVDTLKSSAGGVALGPLETTSYAIRRYDSQRERWVGVRQDEW